MKLKEMSLIVDYKRKKSGVKARIPQTWASSEETQLRELYEEFKDAPGAFFLYTNHPFGSFSKLTFCTFTDPLGCIMPRLQHKRPKNRIIEKMLVLGLIQDKKELRKKRTMGGGRNREYNLIFKMVTAFLFNTFDMLLC